MNRAVMLRFAACGIIGLGAALLIAALLLTTYTSSRIAKIPLDVDATLVSDGTASQALDSASLSTDHVVINQNVPLVSRGLDQIRPAVTGQRVRPAAVPGGGLWCRGQPVPVV